MKFLLNDQEKEYEGDLDISLLTYLREHENILSLKDGCAPQAACGACTVDLNGKAVLACAKTMNKVDAGTVTTIEGLGSYRQSVFANAFLEKGAVQCGFCIPGIVMRANCLINLNSTPTSEVITKALTPNLCRCTGYKKVIEAIQYAAVAIKDGEEIATPKTNGGIGVRQPKYDGRSLVLGQHQYVDDVRLDGMRFGALKFSDHPRAKVVSIDVSQAEKLQGVLRVFTAGDVPGERFVGILDSDWPLMVSVGENTSYIGDVLASVVAETENIARKAVELINIEYEVLDPVVDVHLAMEPNSPIIREGGNVASATVIERGDVENQTEESEYIVQGLFETQRIEHAYMEPECAVCSPLEGGLHLLSQSQGIYSDRQQLSSLLNLPKEKMRVTLLPNGGGFGGKEDLTVQGHAALMAYHLSAPVKVRLTRDESMRMSTKRHAIWMDYTIGCDKQGKLTFVKANFLGDTGAYASVGVKVLERAAGHATGAYHFPAAAIRAEAVFTNNNPCGAMRGFGANQAIFGLESLIDQLCEKGGFDRWQFRYDNALVEGSMTSTGQILEKGVGVRETLLAVKDQYYSAKYAGLACAIKNTGIGNGVVDESSVRLTVAKPGKLIIEHGWTEMGQGVNTVALQVVCQETGLKPPQIEVRIDTEAEQIAGITTASRATSLLGNALIEASGKLSQDLENHSLDELIGREYNAIWSVDWTTAPESDDEKVITHYSYSYATQLVILDEEKGFVKKVVAAHDAGKIINPMLFEGQLEGSIHMGLGYALSEDFPMEGGYPVHTNLRKLGILRARQMPEVEVIGIEVPDQYGPYGAKGVGEIGLLPTAAAVANALYQHDGQLRNKLPMQAPKIK